MNKATFCAAACLLLSLASVYAVPQIPVLISPPDLATGIPASGAELVWAQPDFQPPFYMFQVYLDLTPGFPEPPVYVGPGLELFNGMNFTFHTAALLDEEMYYWYVKVIDTRTGQYANSPWRRFTTAPITPGPPILLYPADGQTGIPTDGVTLQFDQPGWQVESFFDIYVDIDPAFPNPVAYSGPLTPGGRTILEYHLAALLAEQPYYWFVRYSNFVDYWTSAIFNFTTSQTAVPWSLISGSVSGGSQITVPSVRVNCTGACVPASLNAPLGSTFSFTVNNGLNPVVAPVSPGPLFYFTPAAYSFLNIQSNQTANFTMHCRLPANAISPIPGYNAQNVSISIGNLSWEYPDNIYYDLPTGFNVFFPADSGTPVYVPYAAAHTIHLPPLEYSTTYTWKVVPFNDYGEAENVEIWSFTTEDPPQPPPPPVLISPPNLATEVPFVNVEFQWSSDPDWWVVSFFDVYCDPDPGFPEPPIYSGTGSELLNQGIFTFNQAILLDEQAYFWYVRITSLISGLSANSVVWYFTTAPSYLPAPSLSIAADGTLNWPAVTGADYYKIYRCETPDGTYQFIITTQATSWLDPDFPAGKAFYRVTAVAGENTKLQWAPEQPAQPVSGPARD